MSGLDRANGWPQPQMRTLMRGLTPCECTPTTRTDHSTRVIAACMRLDEGHRASVWVSGCRVRMQPHRVYPAFCAVTAIKRASLTLSFVRHGLGGSGF